LQNYYRYACYLKTFLPLSLLKFTLLSNTKNMENTDYPPQNTGGVRSTFLTVICVLTFIGSGWGIIKAVREYATADTIVSMTTARLDKVEDKLDDKDQPGFVKGIFSSLATNLTAPNIRRQAILSLVSCLLTLGGAVMMWNLKKTGFYLYIAGTIVLVAAPVIMMGTGVVGLIASGMTALIGVVFIGMYGANLKDMRG
jgi:hypothetical protein